MHGLARTSLTRKRTNNYELTSRSDSENHRRGRARCLDFRMQEVAPKGSVEQTVFNVRKQI